MRNIIILDEDSRVHDSIIPVLRAWFPEHTIHVTTDGAEGWNWLQELNPELVISELCLPNVDGLELLSRMQVHFPDTQVILTNENRFILRQIDKKFGVQGFVRTIAKPFQPQDLLDLAMPAICGELACILRDLSIVSVMQMLSLEGKSGWMEVTSASRRGAVRFFRGEIVYAFCGGHSGIDAMLEMLRFEDPCCKVYRGDERVPQHLNIFAKFNELMLLCCSTFDEGSQVA